PESARRLVRRSKASRSKRRGPMVARAERSCCASSTDCSTKPSDRTTSAQDAMSFQDRLTTALEQQIEPAPAVALWQALRCRGLTIDLAVAAPAVPALSRTALLVCD